MKVFPTKIWNLNKGRNISCPTEGLKQNFPVSQVTQRDSSLPLQGKSRTYHGPRSPSPVETAYSLYNPFHTPVTFFVRLLPHELCIFTKLKLSGEFGSCWVSISVCLAEIGRNAVFWGTVSGWQEGSSKGSKSEGISDSTGLVDSKHHDCDISGVLMCVGSWDPLKHLETKAVAYLVFFQHCQKNSLSPSTNLCWLNL